jgi:tRNA-modifying protein YgfZ
MNPHWQNLLETSGARFADGRVADFGHAAAERAALNTHAIMCDLSHEGLIHATGDDAASFLHNQLSNDVLALQEGDAQRTSWCSPKGRMLVTPLLWREDPNTYHLQLPRALQAAIQKRLQMFVLRAKVKLTDASDDCVRIGVGSSDGTAAKSFIHGVFGAIPDLMKSIKHPLGRVIAVSPTRFEIVATAENAVTIWQQRAPSVSVAGADVWDLLAIRDGVINVQLETQDQFVPQMANLELIGGVSFKKGCYPGQEIVARTQYRGILKRRTIRAHIDSATRPAPGESVYAAEFGEQAAGQIANVAAAPDGGFEALVVAQIDAIKGDSLRLLSGTALKVLPLPYSLGLE